MNEKRYHSIHLGKIDEGHRRKEGKWLVHSRVKNRKRDNKRERSLFPGREGRQRRMSQLLSLLRSLKEEERGKGRTWNCRVAKLAK